MENSLPLHHDDEFVNKLQDSAKHLVELLETGNFKEASDVIKRTA